MNCLRHESPFGHLVAIQFMAKPIHDALASIHQKQRKETTGQLHTCPAKIRFMKIALIAHDKKKNDMIKLSIEYKDVLSQHELYATGTTGTLVMGETGLPVNRMKSGPLGGDQQIGSMVAEGKLDLIIFLRDPLTSQPHEPDVSALLRLCDVQSIPLATNVASAKIILSTLRK